MSVKIPKLYIHIPSETGKSFFDKIEFLSKRDLVWLNELVCRDIDRRALEQPCPKCKGIGTIPIFRFCGDDTMSTVTYDTCSECQGYKLEGFAKLAAQLNVEEAFPCQSVTHAGDPM